MAPKQEIERTPRNVRARLVKFRLSESELMEANFLAADTYRSRALFIRLMYLRGLVAYKIELSKDLILSQENK